MHNFGLLVKGEFNRMVKYKILQISFAVTLLWLLMIWLIDREQATTFIPLFIFMDASVMTIMMIGANLFFEKQENTLKTLLITPSSFKALIASKVISAIYLALQSTIILAVVPYFLFDVDVRFIPLIGFVIIIAFAHAFIGFAFSIYSKDFNSMLVHIVIYMLVFAFPSIFYAFGIVSDAFERVLLFSPTHASMLLLDYAYYQDVALWIIAFGLVYLLLIGCLIMRFIVVVKYHEDAVRD